LREQCATKIERTEVVRLSGKNLDVDSLGILKATCAM
jgi:hypothetical protein